MTSVGISPTAVPLDYRYALDAARVLLGTGAKVICGIPQLEESVRERFLDQEPDPGNCGALWIEPRKMDWYAQLIRLEHTLPVGSELVIVISRPMSRLIPERQSWDNNAVGVHPRGERALLRNLSVAGFDQEEAYGIHTLDAIVINLLSRAAGAIGRPDWSDRLHFAGRLRYCRSGHYSAFATVRLLRMKRVRT